LAEGKLSGGDFRRGEKSRDLREVWEREKSGKKKTRGAGGKKKKKKEEKRKRVVGGGGREKKVIFFNKVKNII
jgi:hypothetical protein